MGDLFLKSVVEARISELVGEQKAPARPTRVFVFYWKDSKDELFRTSAVSLRQAIYKLGLKRGHEWARDGLETGQIYHDVIPDTPDLGKERCPHCGSSQLVSRLRGSEETYCKDCGRLFVASEAVERAVDQLLQVAERRITPELRNGRFYWITAKGELVEVPLFGHGDYVLQHLDQFGFKRTSRIRAQDRTDDGIETAVMRAIDNGGIEIQVIPSHQKARVFGLKNRIAQSISILYNLFKRLGVYRVSVIEIHGQNAELSLEDFLQAYYR